MSNERLIEMLKENKEFRLVFNLAGFILAAAVFSLFLPYASWEVSFFQTDTVSGSELIFSSTMMLIGFLLLMFGALLVMLWLLKAAKSKNDSKVNNILLFISMITLFTSGVFILGAPILYEIPDMPYTMTDTEIAGFFGGFAPMFASGMLLTLWALIVRESKLEENSTKTESYKESTNTDSKEELMKYKEMLDLELITQEDYDKKKHSILHNNKED